MEGVEYSKKIICVTTSNKFSNVLANIDAAKNARNLRIRR